MATRRPAMKVWVRQWPKGASASNRARRRDRPRDETLFNNLTKAHRYFTLIRSGKTYAEIAEAEGISKHRIHKLLGLTFLAPDVVRDVFAGSQPTGLTTEWLLRHAVPALWEEQRDLFRSL